MTPFNIILGLLAAIVAAGMILRHVRGRQRADDMAAEAVFVEIVPLLADAKRMPGESVGSQKLTGTYRGEVFQFTTVVDTLAVRKLPSLWLLVTLPKPQPRPSTIDLMMRPAGPATFSHFDFLPVGLATPQGFPEHAVIRSDIAGSTVPVDAMTGALSLFHGGPGKELLISPKGLRMVVQLGQADRLRYGVFREARFETAIVDAALASTIMNTLLDLDAALRKDFAHE
jgi:hypothetical protein